MSKQERITFLLETVVSNILEQINHKTSINDRKNLRCQFDAELDWKAGKLTNGQYTGIIEKHTID